jgi:phosphoribosylformylglycinamidine synthase
VHDITTSDLTDGRVTNLNVFRGLVFPGGFTYSDVLGSAAGWEAVLTHNTKANQIVQEFRSRTDTFVLGVCNGCQLLARLGWVSGQLTQNTSGRFESRFVTVNLQSDTFWTKGLNDVSLGVWVSHGEGKFVDAKNVVMTYFDPFTDCPAGPTHYPRNPNGSVDGVAAITSDDGRVLAMMPHPERCYRGWQLPWAPVEWKEGLPKANYFTPWIKLFQNAHDWCDFETK